MKPFEDIKRINPLLGGQVLSIFGDRLALVALIEMLSLETERFKTPSSIFELSKLSLAMTLPTLLLAPLIGTYVDRVSRKKILIASDLWRGLIVILIPPLHLLIPLWAIYLVVALMSLINLFFLPARCAIVPQLIENQKIAKANSVLTIGATFATIAGFAIGGTIASMLGWKIALVIDAFTFFASAGFMMMLKPIIGLPPSENHLTSRKILKQSIREIKTGKNARLATISPALLGASSAAAYMLGIPILQRKMEQATMWIGIIVALGGLGIAIGSYLIGSQRIAIDYTKGISRFSLVAIGLLAIPGITSSALVIALAVFAAGIAAGPVLVLSETILQKQISLNRQATVFAARDVFVKAAIVATSLVAPLLAIWIGDRAGVLILAGAIGTSLLFAVKANRAIPSPPP
ncbi:MAG: MFS transporter [bacterium]